MQRKKVREQEGLREERGDIFWMRGGRRRTEKEAAIVRSYLKENEWTKSTKVAARSNKEDEIHG